MSILKNTHDLIIVAFDIETTGLDPRLNKIIEFGAIKFSGSRVLEETSFYINPKKLMQNDVIKIHGITNQMIADAEIFRDKKNDIFRFFSDSIIIAHNASFDWSFLETEMTSLCEKIPRAFTVIDTKILAKKAFPGLKSYALEQLSNILTIQKTVSHRALEDARTCMKLFNRCIEELSFLGFYDYNELLNFSIQTRSKISNI